MAVNTRNVKAWKMNVTWDVALSEDIATTCETKIRSWVSPWDWDNFCDIPELRNYVSISAEKYLFYKWLFLPKGITNNNNNNNIHF